MTTSRTYGKARLQDGYWNLQLEPHVSMVLKRVMPRLHRDDVGILKIKNTDEVCRELEWFTQRYPLDVKPFDALRKRAARHKEQAEIFAQLVAGEAQPQRFDLAVPPRDYQRIGAECMLRMKSLILGDDMGVGKTCTAICAITDPRARPALVVTMTSLPGQWQDAVNRFCPQLRTHILKNGKPYDVRSKGEFPDVVITSYSKLSGWADSLNGKFKSVTFDEGQELRSKGTKEKPSLRYKAAVLTASQCEFCWVLSGTPIFNFGEEFLNIFDVIKPGALGTRAEFVNAWCGKDEKTGKACIKQPKAFGAYLRDAGLMLRRTRADAKRELPPMQRIVYTVDADEKVLLDVDADVEKYAMQIISASTKPNDRRNAYTQLDWRLRQATGLAKAPEVCALISMLVESGERVVVFAWHKSVHAYYKDKLKEYNPAFYTGDETTNEKVAAKRAFLSGESRVLVLSLRTAAGLDGLQHVSRTVVFGELDWAWGPMIQCEDRVNRDGQPDPVNVYYPLSDSGSDPIVSQVLGLKRLQLEGVLNHKSDDVVQQTSTGDGIRKIAEQYLARKGRTRGASATVH